MNDGKLNKINVGDYILTEDIPDQATLDHIRRAVRMMGYNLTNDLGYDFDVVSGYKHLVLSSSSTLAGRARSPGRGNAYTPDQVFAMVSDSAVLEHITLAITRIERELAELKTQLVAQVCSPATHITYRPGDQFYVGTSDGDALIGYRPKYLLTRIDQEPDWPMMCLVDTSTGNKFGRLVRCDDPTQVTRADIAKMVENKPFHKA